MTQKEKIDGWMFYSPQRQAWGATFYLSEENAKTSSLITRSDWRPLPIRISPASEMTAKELAEKLREWIDACLYDDINATSVLRQIDYYMNEKEPPR